ncbi:hypothetical protein RYH80_17715 [Halobaculum sp. MBLA0147]|uniref:hypothetical protein n=1 Tax=Halobaculum sp. MBLA0147 TaxID=3079934 RepID=UPI0035246896
MAETLELPDGSVVGVDEVFLYNGYPYRFVPVEGDGEPAFLLSPLYWGGGDMDVPFADREALSDQWEPGESGRLDETGWRDWLAEAREDDTLGDAEVEALATELLDGESESGDSGLLDRLARLFG